MRQTVVVLFAALLLMMTGGCGLPSFLITPVMDRNALEERRVLDGEGMFAKKILILPIDGFLMNARSPGLMEPGENTVSIITQQLRRAEEDGSVAAVVLRINSPGGTVTGSDVIYQQIRDFRARTGRPIIASVQEVSASGAYLVSMSADEIVAQPTSIVGSIGVIFTQFNFLGTLDKIGAGYTTIKSGELKDMGSPLKRMTPEERRVMEEMLAQYFDRFRNLVDQKRGLTDAQVAEISSGRVFTGDQAKALNLVDHLGTLEDAIELARKRSGAKGASAVMYVRPYGYGGSIYASNQVTQPRADVTQLQLPMTSEALPTGFYYLWRPGL